MTDSFSGNLLSKLKPDFWDHRETPELHSGLNFRRKWKLIVLLTAFIALLPLLIMTLVDFSLTRRSIEKQTRNDILTLLNTVARAVSFSLEPPLPPGSGPWRGLGGLLQADRTNDLFITGLNGKLHTPSFYFGEPGTSPAVNPEQFTGRQGIVELLAPDNTPVFAGYRRIGNPGRAGTPDGIIVLLRPQKRLADLWLRPRIQLIGYLLVSIVLILVAIMGMATFLVNRIHAADRMRIEALQHEEHANRLASIGRLASGLAHEINNPLAIISQKTGLMTDLLTLNPTAALHSATGPDGRLVSLAGDVLNAVDRCSNVTRRLLAFARHMEPCIEPVDIGEVLDQVKALLEAEALARNVALSIDPGPRVPGFECDRSSFLQIFLNLSENALAAMENGGSLKISVKPYQKRRITIVVADTGKGIPEDDIHKIFEPFFTSRSDQWGDGLGLAITYGLVREMGGDIKVKSRIGAGTTFTLFLPLKAGIEKSAVGGGLVLPETGKNAGGPTEPLT